jgi:cell division protein FtsI/penicillin-binding protein 2
MMKQFKPVLWIASGTAVLAVCATAFFLTPSHGHAGRALAQLSRKILPHMERKEIAALLGSHRFFSKNLTDDSITVNDHGKELRLHLTLDKELQERVEDLYERYNPAYAAFVAIDPDTGKILAMVDHSAEGHEGNLALQATYPAASTFKIVTSAAALGEGKIPPNTRFAVNGRYGTLYKSNLRNTVNRWTRFISIEEAFAKSVNTVFAKIAMNRVGPAIMQRYADAFGFNQKIDFDMPMEMGSAVVPTDDAFGLAESGSGYTRRQTLNPIQGAMMAASVINGGNMPAPYIVDSVTEPDGTELYEAEVNNSLFHPLDRETARSLAAIMEHTVTQGTARKEYRDYNHHPVLSRLFIGAKTGSLSGMNPAGRYDWFIGFAQLSDNPRKKIAFASMIVNRKFWRVKSAYIAREAIIEHFRNLQDSDI